MRKPLLSVLLGVAICSLMSTILHTQEDAGSRPNIVFMLADDMGWAQPGFNGGDKRQTPNIDKLAGESLKLTQFYGKQFRLLQNRFCFNWLAYPVDTHIDPTAF